MIASLALLAALAAPGIAVLVRLTPFLTPLERFAHGAVLGIVVGTLAMLPLGTFFGLSPLVLFALAAGCVVLAGWLLLHGGLLGAFTGSPEQILGSLFERIEPLALLIMVGFTIRMTRRRRPEKPRTSHRPRLSSENTDTPARSSRSRSAPPG